MMPQIRIGQGWDLHRLQPGGTLWIGGICVSEHCSAVAHSDGDFLAHALIDALLGALAAGDIGQWFPDNDSQWANISGAELVQRVWHDPLFAGWQLINLDCTVQIQSIRLAPFREAIQAELARWLGVTKAQISVKAKTHEGVDAIGRGEAAAAQVALIIQREVV